MNPALVRRVRRAAATGFTLLEVVIAMALSTVVFAAGLSAIVFLQKSYAATEQYATSLADQTRLLDYLAMDLRRAVVDPRLAPGAPQPVISGSPPNTLTLVLPNYYSSTGAPNSPKLNLRAAYYDSDNNPITVLTVVYQLRATFQDPKLGLLLNAITRQEGGGVESAVAAGMKGFPDVTFWNSSGGQVFSFHAAIQARITLSFSPRFQTPATPDNNLITLHALTYLRNNDVH